jgi:hypothetical protein
MDSIVDPAADYIWNAVGTTIDIKGIHERRPRTDEDWHELRRHAIHLVEAANLIAIPGRKVAAGNSTVEHREALDVSHIQQRLDAGHDQVVGLADLMRQMGQQLAEAADHKDVDAVLKFGGDLDMVCEACHRVFWYPDDPSPAELSSAADAKGAR